MPAIAPVPPLPEVTVPLHRLIPPLYRHYFNRRPDRPNFKSRRYDFPGLPAFLPLMRAFLDTCAADQNTDFRFVFTLLGSELVGNALRHSQSGAPGGTYVLVVRRSAAGLTLVCRDQGRGDITAAPSPFGPVHSPTPRDERGRGLAIVDALATTWGDDARAGHRNVWLHLAFDLDGSAWSDL